jgi:hypothetical protein
MELLDAGKRALALEGRCANELLNYAENEREPWLVQSTAVWRG